MFCLSPQNDFPVVCRFPREMVIGKIVDDVATKPANLLLLLLLVTKVRLQIISSWNHEKGRKQ